ncbi:hypothetical protein ABTY98_21740 [Streptomyces sp. NPDC096040]|uniref:hypothetical protein n=1 Tax=Streptomyces sp. NPDC096040 TaxID=3155541 RepID=UPI00332E85EA
MNQLTASSAANAISTDPQPEARTEAAGLYLATVGYAEALRMPDPAATLDRMPEAVDEIAEELAKGVNAEGGAEFTEALRAATVLPLKAYAAIEHARAETADAEVGYLFDLLADNLKAGADPRMIRRDALAAPARIRELAEAAR